MCTKRQNCTVEGRRTLPGVPGVPGVPPRRPSPWRPRRPWRPWHPRRLRRLRRPRRPWPLTIPNVGVVVSFALISNCQWMERHTLALCTSVGGSLIVLCCCFCCCCFVVCLLFTPEHPKTNNKKNPCFIRRPWRPRLSDPNRSDFESL